MKKVIICILSLICAFSCLTCFSACGSNGAEGKSAYEIWLDNGHSGTETDFLNWLKGEGGTVTVEKCNHSFDDWEEILNSTCTQIGCYSRECTKCGFVQYNFTECEGHSWNDGVFVLQPNCIDNGLIIQTCEACGQTNSVVLYALGHNFVNGKCSICGELASSEQYLEYTLNDDGESYSVNLRPALRNNVTFVNIPESYNGKPVTALAARGFISCTELKQVNLPEGLLSIGDYAFSNCPQLEEVVIPQSVVSIGNNPFVFSKNTVVNVENNSNFNIVGGALVDIKSKTLICGFSSTEIPADGTVTSIGANAFCGNNLTEINIPKTITSIGRNAFGNSKLLDVYYEGTEAEWNEMQINEYAFVYNAVIHFNA